MFLQRGRGRPTAKTSNRPPVARLQRALIQISDLAESRNDAGHRMSPLCGPAPTVPSCLETVLYIVCEDVFGTFWRPFNTQIQNLSIKQGLPVIRSSQLDVWTGTVKI